MLNFYNRIRELLNEVVISIKQAKAKLKKLVGLFFLSASLRELNTPTNQDFLNLMEISKISIEKFCDLYPRRVKKLFASLDLNRSGLETVKKAVKRNDLPAAIEALIIYYRDGESAAWLRKSDITMTLGAARDPFVEPILNDTFTFQSITGNVPRRNNSLLDWSHTGLKNDKEWAWFLNRHYHLLDLFTAYQKTGNPIYVSCINNYIIDWIISSPSKTSPQIWAQWRGLEVSFRILHWTSIFYGLQQVDAFNPIARILMLSSILDHAHYLRHLHSWGANWIAHEMNALATVGLCWQEFKLSKQWLNYARKRMTYEINEQVYPDGVHKELTSHYHRVTLLNFQNFASLLATSQDISPNFLAGVERMWNYLAYSMRPNGHGVLNNDSDLDYNHPLISEVAASYQRPDWLYISTNGSSGTKPQGEPSIVFPWAGQVIMRSGWDKLAHWSFFDIGPLGIYYHVHNDKLHLSVNAYGRDLLVDSGRYTYARDRFWQYFRESASHNIILIDGNGQKTDIKQSHQPVANRDKYTKHITAPEFDFARGIFDRGFRNIKGKATHSRGIVYLRGKYWVVVDHISTDRPRTIQALWHFHPDCTVALEGESVNTIDADIGNLKIMPTANISWNVELVQGQESPIQGWWSREYNQKIPNPTAIYSTQIKTSTTFAWVLVPAKGIVPAYTVNLLRTREGSVIVSIKIPGQTEDKIAVRMAGEEVIDLGNGLDINGDCTIFCSIQKCHILLLSTYLY